MNNLNIIKEAFETSDEEMKEAEVASEIEENANKRLYRHKRNSRNNSRGYFDNCI